MLVNVRDFSSPAAAIAAAQTGDRIYFPGPTPGAYIAPAGGWTIQKSLEIFGDGPGMGTGDTGTTLKPNSANDHVFVIQAPVDNVHIRDLKIKLDNQPASDGTGNGIHCLTTTNNKATGLQIERVQIANLGNDGIHIDGNASAVIFLHITDCQVVACRGSGLYLKNCSSSYVQGGYLTANRKFGAYIETCGIRLIAVAFENNQAAGASNDYDAQLRLKLSHAFTVLGCHVEEFDNNANAKTGVSIENCVGGHFGGGYLGNATGVAGSRGIFISSASRGIVVGPNQWSYVDMLVEIKATDNNTGCIIMPQLTVNMDANTAGTISLPDQDGNGNFAFVPTTKTSNVGAGILLPRVTTTVRDAIPSGILQRGLVLYNSTTGKLNFYDGTAWRAVTSA
jgi:hypothetical protein